MIAAVLIGCQLLSLDRVMEQWKSWKGYDRSKKIKNNFDDTMSCFPVDHVQSVYFTKDWIPISHASGGNHLAIDMAPGSCGTIGQIMICGRDDTFHPVLAADWAQFLTDVADEMERRNWRIEYHESDNDYEFNVDAPRTIHVHDVGAHWSRCKLACVNSS